jgi:signal transduction histidine kinase
MPSTSESLGAAKRFVTRLPTGTLIRLALLVFMGELVGWVGYLLTKSSDPALAQELARGALTLFFGALLGGVVKVLVEDFDLQRASRAANAEFINNVLADLKDVYDRVERAKTLIAAHRSAKTYGHEMRALIDSRVKLLNVIRAIDSDPRASEIIAEIRTEVKSMKEYLDQIVTQFQSDYKTKADLQRVHEAKINRALGKPDDAEALKLLKENEPWESIAKLDAVKDWLPQTGPPAAPGMASPMTYQSGFVEKLNSASSKLRKALKTLLS